MIHFNKIVPAEENKAKCLKCGSEFIDNPKIPFLTITSLNRRIWCNSCIKKMRGENGTSNK